IRSGPPLRGLQRWVNENVCVTAFVQPTRSATLLACALTSSQPATHSVLRSRLPRRHKRGSCSKPPSCQLTYPSDQCDRRPPPCPLCPLWLILPSCPLW